MREVDAYTWNLTIDDMQNGYLESYPITPNHVRTNERCPHCGALIWGLKWMPPLIASFSRKRNLTDFISIYGDRLPFLVSERALTVFEENGITGITSARKLEKIFYKKTEIDAKYYSLELEKVRCSIDFEKTSVCYQRHLEPEKFCPVCRPWERSFWHIFGLHLKTDLLSVPDMFWIYELGTIPFLSPKFVEICRSNNLTGLRFEHIHEYDSLLMYSESSAQRMSQYGKLRPTDPCVPTKLYFEKKDFDALVIGKSKYSDLYNIAHVERSYLIKKGEIYV